MSTTTRTSADVVIRLGVVLLTLATALIHIYLRLPLFVFNGREGGAGL